MSFDAGFAIAPTERHPGWRDARCRVTVTPRNGPARVVEGPYLDARVVTGPVTVGDGIEAAVHDLALPYDVIDLVLDAVAADIDGQLAASPRAVVTVTGGCRIEVELMLW